MTFSSAQRPWLFFDLRIMVSHANPMNILLLGSTGQGKSALGNFLLRPEIPHIWEEEGCKRAFPVGDDRRSCTTDCWIESSADGRLRIMDTPGLNESHAQDLPHMINVVMTARDLGHVHAVILVMKIGSRMDQPYKDTTMYYYKLLGKKVFEANLLLVLTDLRPNDRKYKKNPQLLWDIVEQSQCDVKEMLGLQRAPYTVAINSMPHDDKELEQSMVSRSEILEGVAANQAPSCMEHLKVPKTEAVRRKHEREAAHLRGEIQQMEERKRQVLELPDPVKEHAKALEDQNERCRRELEDLKARNSELDTADLCQVGEASNERRGFGKRLFCIKSRVPIQDFTRCASGLRLQEYKLHEDKRTLEGHFVRHDTNLFSFQSYKVICWGSTREFHADELRGVKQKLIDVEEHHKQSLRELTTLQRENPGLTSPHIKDLSEEIIALQEKAESLESDHFDTVEAAQEEVRRMARGRGSSKL